MPAHIYRRDTVDTSHNFGRASEMLASASALAERIARPDPRARPRAGFRCSRAVWRRGVLVRRKASSDRGDDIKDDENEQLTIPKTTHVVCMSFDTLVDATDEMCLVGHEAARRFWPKKIPGGPNDYADVFRMLMPCLEESSSFEGALMVRVMAEENIAERTRFRMMLKRRKAERLKMEAAERAAMERAVTAKQRERFEAQATRRAAELVERRKEYKREMERMTQGRSTRPLNLREVVAAWDEIKLHASMKFGCDLQTDVGWEGLTVQPAGLQSVVNEVREAFGAGTVTLSRDDTGDDDEEEEEACEEEMGPKDCEIEDGPEVESADARPPKERWLASHRLHHGAAEFLEACVGEGHEVLVLGGPYRSAACVRTVLSHLGVDVVTDKEEGEKKEKRRGSRLGSNEGLRDGSCRRRGGGHRARARRGCVHARTGDAVAAVAPRRLEFVRAGEGGQVGAHRRFLGAVRLVGPRASQGQGTRGARRRGEFHRSDRPVRDCGAGDAVVGDGQTVVARG